MRSRDDLEIPNLQYHFVPIAMRYDGGNPAGGHGFQMHVGPMKGTRSLRRRKIAQERERMDGSDSMR